MPRHLQARMGVSRHLSSLAVMRCIREKRLARAQVVRIGTGRNPWRAVRSRRAWWSILLPLRRKATAPRVSAYIFDIYDAAAAARYS